MLKHWIVIWCIGIFISCSKEDEDRCLAPSEVNFTFDDVQYWIGEGENKSVLIVKWNDEKFPDALVWGYKWNSADSARGIDMITNIAANDKRFFALRYRDPALGYAIAGIGYDINGNNSIQLNNGTAMQTPVDGIAETTRYDFDDWICTDSDAHWAAGWYVGYWSYWLGKNGEINGNYKYSGLGASSRKLENGSIDLWYWDANMSSAMGTSGERRASALFASCKYSSTLTSAEQEW